MNEFRGFLGKYEEAGCTVKFLLDWAWNSVSSIKQSVDKTTIPLFDMSCVELPESTRQSLMSQCRQLRHLAMVFHEVRKKFQSRIFPQQNANANEIKLKHELVQLIAIYLEVILWFFSVGLLPEVSFENGADEENSFYPVRLLAQQYRAKRKRMKAKLTEWLGHDGDSLLRNGKNTAFDGTGLMIDGLCQALQSTLVVRKQ